VRALAGRPETRPTARALADALEQYLDGDRDLERRRSLAEEHLAAARTALASGDPELRPDALRAAGRALALDPHSDAATIIATLLVEPTHQLPAKLGDQLRKEDNDHGVWFARAAALALSAFFMFVPVVLWVGVKQPVVVGALFGYVAAQLAYNVWMTKRHRSPGIGSFLAYSGLAILLSRLFSPFVVVPGLLITAATLAPRQAALIRRPWLLVGFALATFLVPFGLEGLGVFAPSWSIEGGALVIRGGAIAFDDSRAAVFLLVVNVVALSVAVMFGWALSAQRRRAQQRFEIQAWHLRQLLPEC
jgi:serine/threonine-protein kinase